MTQSTIKIHAPLTDPDTPRLQFFAGRQLSEQAFDLMQAYVDGRCDRLLSGRQPGIVEGLQVSLARHPATAEGEGEEGEGAAGEWALRVSPGAAVGGDGRAVRAFYPIALDWPSLCDHYKDRVTAAGAEPQPVHGFYFLTVRRRVARLDYRPGADPCSRADPDPLRDSRLETYGTLDLQFIADIPYWMDMEPARATNQILKYHLGRDLWDRDTGAVPVALVKAEGDGLAWVDGLAGHFASADRSVHRALFAHWQARAVREFQGFDSDAGLAQNLGVDFLPAAGRLPDGLITEIAGRQHGDEPDRWLPPRLHFSPGDLQLELLPVPANTVDGVLDYENTRGVVDLVHSQQDRIRVMVAVEPDGYHPRLMDLPDIDRALMDELYRRQVAARSTYNAWANQYNELYRDLGGAADEDALREFLSGVYKAPRPADAADDLPEELLEDYGFPVAQPQPPAVAGHIADLLAEQGGQQPLGRPYSQYGGDNIPPPPGDLPAVSPELATDGESGLYRRQYQLQAAIRQQQDDLDGGADLLDEVSDFIGVQRQQLDAVTVSFSALAGGVAGDGSGLSLMRWQGSLQFDLDENTEPGTG